MSTKLAKVPLLPYTHTITILEVIRDLGNFDQHDGDDANVLNADPSVVQVVRNGLTVTRGCIMIRAIPDASKV